MIRRVLTNMEKLKLLHNNIFYQNQFSLESLFQIHEGNYFMYIIYIYMYVKMSKINKFKMDVWTCWAQLSS